MQRDGIRKTESTNGCDLFDCSRAGAVGSRGFKIKNYNLKYQKSKQVVKKKDGWSACRLTEYYHFESGLNTVTFGTVSINILKKTIILTRRTPRGHYNNIAYPVPIGCALKIIDYAQYFLALFISATIFIFYAQFSY